MNMISQKPLRRGSLTAMAAFCLLMAHTPAQAGKTKINYVPGVTLAPDVLLADGQTERTYNTPQGTTFWKEGLPVQQGDKLKLNVFVATGGADLKEIKVRLDNAPLADITGSPWNTVIDTAALTTGSHMVEVWAQATGAPPQSSTKQLSFFVLKQLVKGEQIVQTGGQAVEVTPTGDPNSAPILPTFLAGKTTDADATVSVTSRAASAPLSGPTTPVGTGPLTIQVPTVFIVRTPGGSTARLYAYALVRDGQTILTSDTAYSVADPRQITAIKIQKRSDTTDGLRSGQVSMWVWGVDSDGRPGDPQKVQLVIP